MARTRGSRGREDVSRDFISQRAVAGSRGRIEGVSGGIIWQ